MKEKTIDLKYAKLHLIPTQKFRTIEIKVILNDKIRKEEITKRNFLADFLVSSTKKYNTKKSLSLKTQDLYSAFVSANNSRVGNYLMTRFTLSLLNPKYTEEGMFEESLDLLHEIIFNPNASNEEFDSQMFEIVKNGILSDIRTYKEDSIIYSQIRLLESFGPDLPCAYHGFGYLEDLEEITPKNLYTYYKKFLSSSLVDIYIIGDFKEEEAVRLIKEKLDFKTLKKEKEEVNVYHKKIRQRARTIIEESTFTQSKLAIGCKLTNLNDFERKYVINMYNMILGGGFNSKFMQEIREKNALVYYISSGLYKADNLLVIQSGISYENFKKVLSLIKKIMKNMSKNTITESELADAKMEYLTALDSVYDNIDAIVENKASADLLNLDSLETRREMINKITIKDIEEVSQKVHLDTIYLLKGDSHGKN